MSDFRNCIGFVLKNEGVLFEDAENGEISNYGISQKFLDEIPLPIKSQQITKEMAVDLYKKYFWDQNKIGEIYSDLVAAKILDFMVNAGEYPTCIAIQTTLNITLKTYLKVDGIFGPITRKYINLIIEKIGEKDTAAEIADTMIIYYKSIAKGTLAKYLTGWSNRANNFDTNIPYES